MTDLNVIIAGVGGQGTLLACKVLGNLGMKVGYDVKTSEVHGMSQRGGSVITHVKMSRKVFSPLIEKGRADYLIAFEPLEALRWTGFLKKGGRVIVNTRQINPMPVITGARKYPENPIGVLKAEGADVIELDAYGMAQECGNGKSVNIVLLGVMASLDSIEKIKWLETIMEIVPLKFQEINLAAFEAGFEYIGKRGE